MVLLEGSQPLSTTPDDLTLIYSRGVGANSDIFAFSEGDNVPREPIYSSTGIITNSRISPDGNWVSYVSVETGINQVYVHPYPDISSGKWQISINGGNEPIWDADSKSIYFIGAEDQLYSVTNLNSDEDQFSASLPEIVLDLENVQFNRTRNYAVHPSGDKFLFMRSPETEGLLNTDVVSLVMVENWFEELKRLAPTESLD
jgi:Tol biopolymer transport system component